MERSAGYEDEGLGMSIALESGTTGNATVDGITSGVGRAGSSVVGGSAGAAAGAASRAALGAGKLADKIASIPTPYETAEAYFKRMAGIGVAGVVAVIVLGGLALYFVSKRAPAIGSVTAEFTKGARGFVAAVKP